MNRWLDVAQNGSEIIRSAAGRLLLPPKKRDAQKRVEYSIIVDLIFELIFLVISNPTAWRTRIKKTVASSTVLPRNKKRFYGIEKNIEKKGRTIKKKGRSVDKKHTSPKKIRTGSKRSALDRYKIRSSVQYY